jgi:hypothetical protein
LVLLAGKVRGFRHAAVNKGCRQGGHRGRRPEAGIDQVLRKAIDPGAEVNGPFRGLTGIGGTKVADGSCGWRTTGSAAPGGRLVVIPADRVG